MKVIDTKKGTIAGINIIDFVIILVVVFLVFSFGAKILIKNFEFGGDEMYNAIQAYQKLDQKGFLVEADIKGKWIPDESEFDSRGLIVETRSGAFALKTQEGLRTIWIGGSMGYLEDVAASKLVFRPLDNYVVPIYTGPMTFNGTTQFIDYLKGKKEEFGSDHLLIGGSSSMPADISFVNSTKSAQDIINEFGDLYYVKYYGIVQTSRNEVIIRLRLIKLSELEKLDIDAQKVIVSRTVLYAGYRQRPGEREGYHVTSVEDLK